MIQKATFRQFLSCTPILFVGFIYGCKEGWILATISSFLSQNQNLPPYAVTKDDISWISSVSFTSSSLSVLLCYAGSDKVGRRRFLICIAVFYVTAWSLILFSSSTRVILVCLWLYGIASGSQYVIGYAYIGEVSEPANRELLGASYCTISALGTQVEYLLSLWADYRALALFPLAVSAVAVLASFAMVESPCYLAERGHDERAVRCLRYLNATDGDEAHAALQTVEAYVNERRDGRVRSNWRAMATADNLKLASVMIAINALSTMHAASLVSLTGSYLLDDFAAIVDGQRFVNAFGACRLLLLCCSFSTIRLLDRRKLFLLGYPTAGLLQLLCGCCYYAESANDNSICWLAKLIPYLLLALLAVAALTFGVALEVLKIEVFPHKLKEFYTGLLLCTGDWAYFALVKTYFFAEPIIGNASLMMIYASSSFVASLIVYFFVPITKNKTLLQIRLDLNAESHSTQSTPV